MNNWTVYCHIFPNGKRYIGRTSQLLYKRFRNGLGYKNSPLIENAIKKYGWENIEHVILEENLTEQESIIKEKYYIEQYNTTDDNFGYNISLGGEGVSKYDYETIISLWNEGKNIKEIIEELNCARGTVTNALRLNGIDSNSTLERKVDRQRKDAKKVKQYDLSGKYIRTYNSCGEACSVNNWINKGRGTEIRRVCDGKRPTARGYLWSWDDGTKNDLIFNKEKLKGVKNRKIGKYDLEGTLIEVYNSLADASEAIFGDRNKGGTICAVCYGKRNTAYGYIWKFIDNGEN